MQYVGLICTQLKKNTPKNNNFKKQFFKQMKKFKPCEDIG